MLRRCCFNYNDIFTVLTFGRECPCIVLHIFNIYHQIWWGLYSHLFSFLCCVMLFCLFVFVQCLVFSILSVSLDCPFLIAPSVFFNVDVKSVSVHNLFIYIICINNCSSLTLRWLMILSFLRHFRYASIFKYKIRRRNCSDVGLL